MLLKTTKGTAFYFILFATIILSGCSSKRNYITIANGNDKNLKGILNLEKTKVLNLETGDTVLFYQYSNSSLHRGPIASNLAWVKVSVESSGSGSSDAGSGNSDAGSGNSDAGSGNSDAGSGSSDAGSGSSDAGSGNSDAGSGGSDAGSGNSATGNNSIKSIKSILFRKSFSKSSVNEGDIFKLVFKVTNNSYREISHLIIADHVPPEIIILPSNFGSSIFQADSILFMNSSVSIHPGDSHTFTISCKIKLTSTQSNK